MARRVQLVTSPCGTAAVDAVLDEFRRAVADGRADQSILILPTRLLADRVLDRLLAEQPSGVLLHPNCLTFHALAERIMTVNRADVRHIGVVGAQGLVRTVIDELLADGGLPYYAPVAGTAGFRGSVQGLIGELKRAEIFPEQYARRLGAREVRPGERELGEIYTRYQQHLLDRRLYDAEGRFWNAKRILAEGGEPPVATLHLLAVAGFSDFTGAQIDILRILAERSGRTILSLPCAEDGREDLFETPRRTLARLEAAIGGKLERSVRQETPDGPADLAHVRDHLFRVESPRPSGKPEAVTIVEEAGENAEVERAAVLIKQNVAAGRWQLDGVLVVCRSLQARRKQIAEVFGRHQIAHRLTRPAPLSDSPVVRYLLRWVQLLLDDVPRRSLLALLASPYFRPPPGTGAFERTTVADVEWVTRRAGILRGREGFLERLTGYRAWLERRDEVAQDADELAGGEQRDVLIQASRRAEGFLAGLWPWLERMPSRGTLTQFTAALRAWARDLQLAEALQAEADAAGDPIRAEADLAALARLDDVAGELAATDELSGGAVVELASYHQQLTEALEATSLPEVLPPRGGVTVTDALTARSLASDVVIVLGLAEGEFPPPQPQAVLLSEPSRSRLAVGGVLPDRRQRARGEMFLFYQAVTRARRALVLSYGSTDGRGREILPSPYLDELGRLFAPAGRLPWGLPHCRGTVGRIAPPLAELTCAADLALATAAALWPDVHGSGDPRAKALLAALLEHRPRPTANWLAGIGAELERQDGPRPSAFDGRLADPRILEQLAARFPGTRPLSASHLELYAACPLAFFFRHVLGVEPLEPPAEDLDVKQIGLLAHAVLRQFYRRMAAELSTTDLSAAGLDVERVRQLMADALAERLAEQTAGQAPPQRALWQIQGRRLGRMLERYLAAETQRSAELGGVLPVHFEVSFGTPVSAGTAVDPASTPEPLAIESDVGRIAIDGRIDRVDRIGGRDGPVAVVDYKTGSPRGIRGPADVLRGEAFQMPLYLLAADRLLAGKAGVHSGAFWSLQSARTLGAIGPTRRGPRQEGQEVGWPQLAEIVLDHVRRIVTAIRGGDFTMRADAEPPPYPYFRLALRWGEVRLSRKRADEGGEP
jgi:ATP-dependent helicase/DNAse subunit B